MLRRTGCLPAGFVNDLITTVVAFAHVYSFKRRENTGGATEGHLQGENEV